MTEVAKVSVVPVVVVRVHTVVHIFRIPGGKTLLTKSAAILSLQMNIFRSDVCTSVYLTPGAQDLLKYSAAALTESHP